MMHVRRNWQGFACAALIAPAAVLGIAFASPTVRAQAPALTNTAPPPATAKGILDALDTHAAELKDFVDRGAFNEVWVPALASKDVAVYLDDHLDEIDAAKRQPAQAAVARLVRACWLLDAVGDLGNRPQVVAAHDKYTAALADVHTFFPGA
jgi:hypothetical protein